MVLHLRELTNQRGEVESAQCVCSFSAVGAMISVVDSFDLQLGHKELDRSCSRRFFALTVSSNDRILSIATKPLHGIRLDQPTTSLATAYVENGPARDAPYWCALCNDFATEDHAEPDSGHVRLRALWCSCLDQVRTWVHEALRGCHCPALYKMTEQFYQPGVQNSCKRWRVWHRANQIQKTFWTYVIQHWPTRWRDLHTSLQEILNRLDVEEPDFPVNWCS